MPTPYALPPNKPILKKKSDLAQHKHQQALTSAQQGATPVSKALPRPSVKSDFIPTSDAYVQAMYGPILKGMAARGTPPPGPSGQLSQPVQPASGDRTKLRRGQVPAAPPSGVPVADQPATATDPPKAPPKPQPTFQSYGLGQGLLERVGDKWAAAQEFVQQAGLGQYADVFGSKDPETGEWKAGGGLSALATNLGQVPDAGRPLTALGQSFLFTTGTPAELTEQALGSGVAELPGSGLAVTSGMFNFKPDLSNQDMTPLKQQLVTQPGNVDQERAFQAAMRVAYSGPEAVRNVFNEAIDLQQKGELNAEAIDTIQAKHGIWWKEMVGQMVLDPLGLLSAPGKVVLQIKRIRESGELLSVPLLKAGAKYADDLVDQATVLKGFQQAASVTSQVKDAKGLNKFGTALNPRYVGAVKVRAVEEMQQPLAIMAGNLEKQAQAAATKFGPPGSAKFLVNFEREMGEGVQELATNLARMADDTTRPAAHALLKQSGFGDVAASVTGRRLATTMREMMLKPDGSYGQLSKILEMGTEQGLSAEHVAEAWAVQANRILSDLIETPKFETSVPVKAVRKALEWRRPLDQTFAKMFMGMTFGSAMRNIQSDGMRLAIDGWSPLAKTNRALAVSKGVPLVGETRGIGAVGEEIGGSRIFNFGLELGQKFEKIMSAKIMNQAFADAIDRTWTKIVKTQLTNLPQTGDAILDNHLRRAVANMGYKDITAIDDLERIVLQHIGQAAPVAGSVPPAGAGAARFIEPWREVSSTLTRDIREVDPDLWPEVQKILADATGPGGAVAGVNDLAARYMENLAKIADEAEPVGPALGTVTGEATQQMQRMEKFKPETIEALSESLSIIETELRASQARAISEARLSVQSGDWLRTLNEAQEVFDDGVDFLRRYQTGLYMQFEAGAVNETTYVDRIFREYREIKETLDLEFRRVIREAQGVRIIGDPEIVKTRLLQREVMREGYHSGYASGQVKSGVDEVISRRTRTVYGDVPEVAPDMHWANKVSQIVGRKVKNVYELSDDESLQVINFFRRSEDRGLDPTTYDAIYSRYAKLSQPVQPTLEGLRETVPVTMAERRKLLAQKTIDQWAESYNVDEKGSLIFEPINTTLTQGNPDFRGIVFKRDANGRVLANRSMSHAPGDSILHGSINDEGKLDILLAQSDDSAEVGKYATDLIKNGLDPQTPVSGPTAHALYRKDLTVGALAGGVPSETEIAFAVDPRTGRRIYADIMGKTGEVPYEDVIKHYDSMIADSAAKGGAEAQLAARAIKDSLEGVVSGLAPGPSRLDAAVTASSDVLRLLDGLKEEIEHFAKLPPSPIAAQTPLPGSADWVNPFFQNLRRLHTESATVSAAVARRARDFALLDYRDRRLADPFINFLYPFSYWHTRSIPNWAASIVMNPAMTAHYMAYKRELRDWNSQDTTLPEWAQDDLVLHPPGYGGSIYLNLEAGFNPIKSLFESYTDPQKTKNALGQFIIGASSAGPAIHPLLVAAYAAERGMLHGDTEAARSYGYVAPVSRVFNAVTGITLEPWLWKKDPTTGETAPWTGGTAGELNKAGLQLAHNQATGSVTGEEAALGVATRTGEAYDSALQQILRTRQIPTLASWVLGLSLQPRTEWEAKLEADKQEFIDLRKKQKAGVAGVDEAMSELFLTKPHLSTLLMSNDNERERIEQLAKNVFSRIPPGTDAKSLFDKVGIIPEMRDAFYDPSTSLAEWQRGDYEQFARGIINLAGLLGGPDATDAREWQDARQQWRGVTDDLNSKFPQYKAQSSMYQKLMATQGDDAAKEYGKTSGFFDGLAYKNQQLLANPLILKYYGDPANVDSAVISLAYDAVEQRWPGVHALNDQYHQIEDKIQKRQMLIDNPQLGEFWAGDEDIKRQIQQELLTSRDMAGTGPAAPGTIDYIIKGNPSIAQRGVLDAIEDMKLTAEMRPPLPEIPPSKMTQADLTQMQHSHQAYAAAQQHHPDAMAKEQEYERIKNTYGEESAKLWARQSGLYDYWNEVNLNKIQDPLLLQAMTDEQLTSTAGTILFATAQKQWPNLSQLQDGYYALPKGKLRENYVKANPTLKAYWRWRDTAEPQIMQTLYQQRAQSRGAPAP